MGLAASQARLLTLTARLADNELRSQTINNAKMRLSTESSQASEDYINALNEAQLQFANYAEDGSAQTQSLTYNALTAYSSYNNQYGLVDSSNNLLVTEEEAKLYEDANGDLNKYLEAHGLKYTTTYFDEVGAMTNKNYPDPYDVITVDSLEDMYDRFNATENSEAVQTFEDDYALFQQYTQKAKKEVSDVFDSLYTNYHITDTDEEDDTNNYYLGNTNSEPTTFGNTKYTPLVYKETGITDGEKAVANILEISKAFVTQYADSDAITAENAEKINAYIDEQKDIYIFNGSNLEINGTEASIDVVETTTEPKTTDYYVINGWIKVKKDDNSGNWSASLVYPDDNGYVDVSGNTYDIPDGNGGTTGTITLSGNGTSNSSLATLLKQLKLEETNSNNKTITYNNFTFTDGNNIGIPEDGEIKYSMTTNDSDVIQTDIEILKSNIKEKIFQNINIAEFGQAIQDEYAKKVEEDANATTDEDKTNVSTFLASLGFQKVDELTDMINAVADFENISNEYVGLIFGNDGKNLSELGDFVLQHALNKDLVYGYDEEGKPIVLELSTLEDIDSILKVVDAINDNTLQQITTDASGNETLEDYTVELSTEDFPNNKFQTVIEYSLMNQVLDEYGEPNYTWVDESDTNNTGDAYSKATWYTNLFNRMKNGGYKQLENGLANSSEWIKYAFESGIVTMEQVNSNSEWSSLNYTDCTRITEDYDQNAVTKAEAEYNRAMNDIESKDSAYDIQLKNIDTEHTSIQTEIDVVKNVISKNIERTMKFNQSA